MNTEPTPLTDEAELTEPFQVRELAFTVVRAEFARDLERQLAISRRSCVVLQAEVEKLSTALKCILGATQDPRQARSSEAGTQETGLV